MVFDESRWAARMRASGLGFLNLSYSSRSSGKMSASPMNMEDPLWK